MVYLAGADPFERDRLGGLALTFEGLRRRDRMVFESARAAGAPVAVVLAGGYAADVEDTVEVHVGTVIEALRGVRVVRDGGYGGNGTSFDSETRRNGDSEGTSVEGSPAFLRDSAPPS